MTASRQSGFPAVSRPKVFLFIHGGGYYRGSAKDPLDRGANFAVSGMRCSRSITALRPKIHSRAIDDTYTAYKWLLEQGLAPADIVVGGISAGGGLSGVAPETEGDGEPAAGAVPPSAWTDLTQSGDTMHTTAEAIRSSARPISTAWRGFIWRVDAKTPLASPLFGDLKGLPPLLIQIGTAESMLDDSRRLRARPRCGC